MNRTQALIRADLCVIAFLLVTACSQRMAYRAESLESTPPIVDVHMAAPGIAVVVIETKSIEIGGTATTVDAIDLNGWTIDGTPATVLGRYSLPYDEAPPILTNPKKYPITVRHRIYLSTPPLTNGQAVNIAGPYGSTTLNYDDKVTYCESIHANQVGYNADSTARYANFGLYMGDGGSRTFDGLTYEVFDASNDSAVRNGIPSWVGNDTSISVASSGEYVYRINLGNVPSPGSYYISIPSCGRSRTFGVGSEYSRRIAYVATRGLYHQRCGAALEQPFTAYTRGMCHSQIAHTRVAPNAGDGGHGAMLIPVGTPLYPMSGGYHDAGNWQRLPTHVIMPVLQLSYYEAFPSHFVDGQYRIPESGNGIPDWLDEAMWSVKLYENLQIMDAADPEFGGVMAGTVEQPTGLYGQVTAATGPQASGTLAVSENVSAHAVGMFAHASRLIRPYNAAKANELLTKARLGWAYLQRFNTALPATRYMYASLQMWLATGEQPFHDMFKAAAQIIVIKGTQWPDSYLPGNTTATAQTAHFSSYLWAPNADATLQAALRAKVVSWADRGGYMGPPLTGPYAQGVTKFLGWGAATAQGRYADVQIFAHKITQAQRYYDVVSQYADYALGLNPQGVSYSTGLGTDQPVSPLHLDSAPYKFGLDRPVLGNVPGMLVFGPSEGASGQVYQTAVTNKMWPAFAQQPGLRRYADGWSAINLSEFTTWTTNIWAATMHAFLYDASREPLNCTRDAVGTAVVGLPANVVCVATSEAPTMQRKVENHGAFFNGRQSAMVYAFSGINGYGHCINKVQNVVCQ